MQRRAKGLIDRSSDTDSIFRLFVSFCRSDFFNGGSTFLVKASIFVSGDCIVPFYDLIL